MDFCANIFADIKFHDPNDPAQYQQKQHPPSQQQQQAPTNQKQGHHEGGHHHDHRFGEKLDQE